MENNLQINFSESKETSWNVTSVYNQVCAFWKYIHFRFFLLWWLFSNFWSEPSCIFLVHLLQDHPSDIPGSFFWFREIDLQIIFHKSPMLLFVLCCGHLADPYGSDQKLENSHHRRKNLKWIYFQKAQTWLYTLNCSF
jgi:hypothetical protein